MKQAQRNRKYSVYKTLAECLRRAAVEQSGAVATLLLETFLEDHGKLYADKVVARKLCNPGEFKIWRDRLVKEGWLDFDYNQARKDKDFARHKAGKKLVKYVNKETQKTEQVATKNDFSTVQEQIESLNARKADAADLRKTQDELEKVKMKLERLEVAIDRGIDEYLEKNPPNTKERKARARKNFEDTGKIFVN